MFFSADCFIKREEHSTKYMKKWLPLYSFEFITWSTGGLSRIGFEAEFGKSPLSVRALTVPWGGLSYNKFGFFSPIKKKLEKLQWEKKDLKTK